MLDLGVSSLQLDNAKRGFSFLKEGELDMRMDEGQSFSAKEILLNYDEKKLIQIFKNYGEERYSRSLAKKIVQRRKEQPFLTTTDLSRFSQNTWFLKRTKSTAPFFTNFCVNFRLFYSFFY